MSWLCGLPTAQLTGQPLGEERGLQKLGEEARPMAPWGVGSSRAKGKTAWPARGSGAGSSVKMRASQAAEKPELEL